MKPSALAKTLDRIGVEKLARAQGLPPELAGRVADVVTGTGLSEARRGEVFDELVGHFQDGLSAGRNPQELLASFGDPARAARSIRESKRVVTPESLGGAGTGEGVIARLWRDVRYGFRRLKKHPVFAGIAVASLGIGIGANTAMFTLVNDLIFRQAAAERPEELVDVYSTSRDFPFNVMSIPGYYDFVRGSTAFAGLAASKLTFSVQDRDGRPERLMTELVSGNYFSVYGLRPAAGRLFTDQDSRAVGESPVVVLGEQYWQRAFQGDPSVVGTSIRLSGSTYTIVGVAPAEYAGRLRGVVTDVYLPITMVNQVEGIGDDQFQSRGDQGTFLRGRLKPGVSVAQAEVELERVAQSLREQKVGQWALGARMLLIPTSKIIVFPPIDKLLRPLGAMLLVVVALVLLVSCANLAGFLLARAVDRRKEIAVRLALGASRRQLVSQLLIETVMLSLVGGAFGVWLGRVALRAVLSSQMPFPVPLSLALTFDWRVLGFSLLVSVAAGVLFGLLPALQSTRLDLAGIIRDETTGGGRRKAWARQLLVGGQVALSMVLMVTAGLFVRSLSAARNVDPGFGAKPTSLVWATVRPSGIPGRDVSLLNQLREEILGVPGVQRIGFGGNMHLNTLGTQNISLTVDGVEPPPGAESFLIDCVAVDTGFVNAMGIKLVAGRQLTELDADSTVNVALVNEAFAARFWPGQQAVGRRFRTGGREIEIVGIVNTAKIRTLAEEPRPAVYLPMVPPVGSLWAVAQVAGDPGPVTAAVQRLMSAKPELFVQQARSLADHIGVMSLPLKMAANALMVFSTLALGLACIGLYGAVSYAVSQRTREVGIRLSLGADRSAVIRLLLWGGLRVVLAGVLVGLALALIVSRAVESMLFGVRALDPTTLVAVPVLIVGVATLAAYLPARRAGRIAPIMALRAD